jgi:NADH dehydrogenase/NADH:ubiquinone reductase (non-electrogenic)
VQAKATSIDLARKVATVRDIFKGEQRELAYDKLVLAMGCKTHTFHTPGVAEREREGRQVFFLKHLYHARQIRNRILELFERADAPGVDPAVRARLLSFVVVGGGPTSCEFASELFDFLRADVSRWYPDLAQHVKVTLVEAGPALLGPFDKSLRSYALGLFRQREVDVRLGVSVKAVRSRGAAAATAAGGGGGAPAVAAADDSTPIAVLSDGSEIPFGIMVWSAGLRAVNLAESLELPRAKPSGRILIDGCCRVRGHEGSSDLFAIGDCAVHDERPLAQIAQVASQQGRYVADVLNSGAPPASEFRFFSLGAMVSLGDFRGAYDGTHVGDPHGKELKLPKVSGPLAWLMWRGGYTARQVSLANMLLIPMHWFKSMVFGRDISRF